ncbi:hypothetical protein GGR50DRAFT_684223 [Xylaria sp. CBS 124048]|nr:hypothetical protein GGR50DRAFT_684223 [Xylaria sp. CBS 124048]
MACNVRVFFSVIMFFCTGVSSVRGLTEFSPKYRSGPSQSRIAFFFSFLFRLLLLIYVRTMRSLFAGTGLYLSHYIYEVAYDKASCV